MDRRIIIVVSLAVILTIAVVYLLTNRPASPTTLCVSPQTTQAIVGQNFTVSINISNVADLYGWQLKLAWNATILEVVNVAEGSFLKNGGNTFFEVPEMNNTEGYVRTVCALLPDIPGSEIPGVSGNGVLVTVTFYVKDGGACDLVLDETILQNSNEADISHSVLNGHFVSTS